jgi:hypothetical protein
LHVEIQMIAFSIPPKKDDTNFFLSPSERSTANTKRSEAIDMTDLVFDDSILEVDWKGVFIRW